MRLISELGDALEGAMNYGDQNALLIEYWAHKFGCDSQSPQLYAGLAELLFKVDTVHFAIQNSAITDRAKSLYISAIGQVRIFVHPVNANQLHCRDVVKQHQQVNMIFLAADSLPKEVVNEVNPITIEELSREVAAILDSLGRIEMDPILRAMLATQLTSMLTALHSYRILGVSGVARIFGAAFAEIGRLGQIVPSDAPQVKSLFSKMIDVGKKIGAVIVWGNAFVSGVDGILEAGGSIYEAASTLHSSTVDQVETAAPRLPE